MNALLRDRQPTVVHVDTDVIRATRGLQEYLARPPVVLRACYAVPRAHANGAAHHGAGDLGDGETQEPVASSSKSTSSWLAGQALQDAQKQEGFGAAHELRWPFRSTDGAEDWEGRSFLLSHLYALLGITISSNTSPLLLLPPPTLLSLDEQALYTQIAFETLNVPAFSILPSPLAALYALNAVTGLVLNVGRSESRVFVIVDSMVRWECTATVPVGTDDCEPWLEEIVMKDLALEGQLKQLAQETGQEWTEGNKRKWVAEVVDFVWNECTSDDIEVIAAGGAKAVVHQAQGEEGDDTFDVAKKLVEEAQPQANASHRSKKQLNQAAASAAKAASSAASRAAADAAAAAAADVIIITIPSFPEKEISLGQVRHSLVEPLFSRVGETLQEAVNRAATNENLTIGERVAVWEGLGITGEIAKFKSFGQALLTYLSPYLLSSTELPSDIQPSKVRLLSVPEYFTNFKNSTTELAPFLGGSMVGKIVFGESAGKHYISKVDYNAKGPAAIYAVAAQES